ncbi:hypothetical protein Dred_2679 [Desulforamulus reducens MI-1]|uniref:Transcobalamin-like C-terminal domain-containing protein n=1 Tax=Desulforamulus reducens (strain ATCC BAA-1160 / DSM 100696 / MI-1) TaxID=349161 RepID=A4J7Y2_DESRM|nr:DUF4430 domain-containing protein [Desulforamulus reducens]ABO51185.1 hypothetical protein Dred_2679 [Desulforamulus reducens MI-1]
MKKAGLFGWHWVILAVVVSVLFGSIIYSQQDNRQAGGTGHPPPVQKEQMSQPPLASPAGDKVTDPQPKEKQKQESQESKVTSDGQKKILDKKNNIDKQDPSPVQGGTSPTPPATTTPVKNLLIGIAVVGQQGEVLFGPQDLEINQDNPWGMTAMGVLHATGLRYGMQTSSFVSSIAGQHNKGMNGWMYKVNGQVPMVAATEQKVEPGDRVIWWYSTDINSNGPQWEELVQKKTD